MRNLFTTLGVGLVIWCIPFAVGFAIMPIIHMHHPLFDTLVVLAMIVGATGMSHWYLRKTGYHEKGLLALFGLGLIWVLIAVLMDTPIMIHGPVGMTVHEYMADIGLMYLGIPVILVGTGAALLHKPD